MLYCISDHYTVQNEYLLHRLLTTIKLKWRHKTFRAAGDLSVQAQNEIWLPDDERIFTMSAKPKADVVIMLPFQEI